jgi:hypothetical protein
VPTLDLDLDPSWTAEAADVLRRACDHAGGVGMWRALRCVRLSVDEVSGLLPWTKGRGRTFPVPGTIEVRPHECMTLFLDYPHYGRTGVFENGGVRIESIRGARVVEASPDHRKTFRGLAKYRRWTPADALYFFGYALAHYHALPFTLGAARLLRSTTTGRRDGALDVLEVEFPGEVPTHCRRQTFYVDASGRLTRHDYHVEILGWWARASHYWNRQSSINGLPIAMERHVVARLGSTALPVPILHATFSHAEVELDPVPPGSGQPRAVP